MGLLLRRKRPPLFLKSAPRRRPIRAYACERRARNVRNGGEAISPDGKKLIFSADVNTPQNEAVSKLALVNLDSGSQSTPIFLQPDPRMAISGGNGFTNSMAFTPDGKAVAYIVRDRGVDNIFVQALDGSPGRQITNFTSDQIAEFRWSPDGKTLAVARAKSTSDVVLLREK